MEEEQRVMERDIERMRKQMEKIQVPSKHEMRLQIHENIESGLIDTIDRLIRELKDKKKYIKGLVEEFNAEKMTAFTDEIERLGRELDEAKRSRTSNLRKHLERYNEVESPAAGS